MRARALVLTVVLAATAVPLVAEAASHSGPCTRRSTAGGDWPSYDGPDTTGERNQKAEKRISPSTVGTLSLAWSTSGSGFNTGQGTPVVSGNCAYVFGTDGKVTAFSVTDGKVVWRVTAAPLYPKKHYAFAAAVADGKVYMSLGDGLQAQADDADVVPVALDADTGETVYVGKPVRFDYPNNAGSSAVVFRGMQIVTTTGPDGDPSSRPGYAILDDRTGKVLHAQTTIPPAMLKQGYAGGGIWATPVVDPVTQNAYVGTANPYSKFKQSPYDDAILKIDLNRSRKTFGQILKVYSGTVDQIIPGDNQQPACDIFGDSVGTNDAFSVACLQQDIDFGGSPGLARDSHGRRIVVEIQKSSEVHAVYADTMTRAWKDNLGSPVPPGTSGPLDAPAFDGKHIFIAASSTMFALNPDDGSIAWATPISDGGASPIPGTPVQVANGVVFFNDYEGSLLEAFDASSGRPLWLSNTTTNTGTAPCQNSGPGGLAIAHNMIFRNCGSEIDAYSIRG